MNQEHLLRQEETTVLPDTPEAANSNEPTVPDPRLAEIGEMALLATAEPSHGDIVEMRLVSLVDNKRYLSWIAGQLARIGVYHIAAEDVWLDAVSTSLGHNIDPDRVNGYVVAVARNKIADLARKQVVQRRKYGLRISEDATECELPSLDQSGLSNVEDNHDLDVALGQLTAQARQAILLRYKYRYSIPETAEIMRCAEGTVKSVCFRAINQLRGLLSGDLPMINVESSIDEN